MAITNNLKVRLENVNYKNWTKSLQLEITAVYVGKF